MGFWHSVTHGLRTLLGRERYDQDLDDELQHYLEEAEADLIRNGATPEEARRSVRLQHGDGLSAREDVRDFGWENTVESLWSDVRLAARRLRRSPGFSTIVVLTLGLGIGSATAIFSAASPVLLDSLPYPNADRILALSHRPAEESIAPVAFGTYRELAARNPVFEALTVYKAWQPTVTGGQQPERLEAQRVSAQYFDVLGVLPLLGRSLDSAEDRPGGSNEVILSHSFWQRAFGADPAVLGRTVQLDAVPAARARLARGRQRRAGTPLARRRRQARGRASAAGDPRGSDLRGTRPGAAPGSDLRRLSRTEPQQFTTCSRRGGANR